MPFEFATAARVLFGEGVLREAGPLAAGMARRALVVTGTNPGRAGALLSGLSSQGVEYRLYRVEGEPTVAAVRQGIEYARREACALVIGFGGGGALDAAKAIAILLANAGDLYDYLEVIGRGKSLSGPALPLITIPTTAGSGAEVTRNAVLGSPEHRVKVSLRSQHMHARVALVDPELTYTLPPDITASTGLDALTQLIEPFVSSKSNPMTDAFCREGLSRAGRSLRNVFQDGKDTTARRDMALASLFGGLALANAKLGAVHGFAGVLGGMFPGPHGAICARLLPPVMAANLRALQERTPANPALARYGEVARILTGDQTANAADGVAWVQELEEELRIPPLSAYGLRAADFPEVVEKSAISSSMQGNPLKLSDEELAGILVRAL
jgi:alcohol dehydrogenase class IV